MKNRSSMVNSLMEKLVIEKPDMDSVLRMLGEQQDLDNFQENTLSYYIEIDIFLGVENKYLVIEFDVGVFTKARIVYED